MAQTNVQAFSGDVEISSNLAVNTTDLFVDTVSGSVGIGTTKPAANLHVTSGAYEGTTLINLTVNQSTDASVYYRKIAFVSNNSGHVMIKGVLGGHTQSQGNATVDVKFSARDGFTALGTCMGTLGNSNILVKDNTGNTRKDIYLVTGQYSYVNLQVYAIGGEVFGTNENGRTTTAPSGTTTHDLKTDFKTFRVDDDGNVGIGTTTPYSLFHMHGSGGNQSDAPDSSSLTAGLMLLRNTKTGSTPYSMVLGVDQTTGIGYLNAAGNSEHQPICLNTRGGNVGIGTTDPRKALDVKRDITTGSSTTTNLQTHFNIGNKTLTGGGALMGYSGRASTIVNAATHWKGTGGYYGTSGYFGIAVNNNSASAADPYGITEGELESQTHLAIKSNGNVGIGHTNPLMTLDVNGPMQSWTGRHVKTVPVRHNGYNDIASNGGTLRIGNEVVGGSAGYSGSFCAFDWFGAYSIKNFSADRWVTPNRIRICFRWAFVAGYIDNVTFKIWETLYTASDSLKATITSSNGSLSRGYTTVWGPDMTMIRNDVPGIMIEADSNTTDNSSATVRIADIWLEYVRV